MNGQFLKYECESGFGPVIRNGCHRAVREDSRNFCKFAQVPEGRRDSRFSLIKILVAFCSNFGTAQQTVVAQALLFVLRIRILRIASIAAMFYTSKELDDPPNGRFWTLTLYPEQRQG